MSEKKFIGVVKTVQTQYGELIKISIQEADFNAAKNKDGWVNMTLKKGKDSGKHYLELDTWKPEKKDVTPESEKVDPEFTIKDNYTEELPF